MTVPHNMKMWLHLTPSAADCSTMEQAELNRSTTQPCTDYANDD